jgi:hypothetical protein
MAQYHLYKLTFHIHTPKHTHFFQLSNHTHYRPDNFNAWIKHWELEPLCPLLGAFGLESMEQCLNLTKAHHTHFQNVFGDLSLAHQWNSSIKHISHLDDIPVVKPFSTQYSVGLWLDCWRLSRLNQYLTSSKFNCIRREDILQLEPDSLKSLFKLMKPLEIRRMKTALKLLRDGYIDNAVILTFTFCIGWQEKTLTLFFLQQILNSFHPPFSHAC